MEETKNNIKNMIDTIESQYMLEYLQSLISDYINYYSRYSQTSEED